MFDSQAEHDAHTRRIVAAIKGAKRDAFLAAILYRHDGVLKTTERDLRRLIVDVEPWKLALYVHRETREIQLRLETRTGDLLYGPTIERRPCEPAGPRE